MKRLVAAIVLVIVSAAVSATVLIPSDPNPDTFEWGAPSVTAVSVHVR